MKCDTIATALLAAYDELDFRVPLVVRLEGTNVELGKKLIKESGRKIVTADGLTDAARRSSPRPRERRDAAQDFEMRGNHGNRDDGKSHSGGENRKPGRSVHGVERSSPG